MIIAIDGPAGSGKTTTAKLLAHSLGIFYLDTGATYRALTYAALQAGIEVSDAQALRKLAEKMKLLMENEHIYLNGVDISQDIRTPRIDKHISAVVEHPQVRQVMVALQRKLAGKRDCVVEGRDITTVVFPQAEFKFYLDANSRLRAQRRFKELQQKGINIVFSEVEKDLQKRDSADKNRKVGSLQMAKDSVYIDTSGLTIEATVHKITEYMNAIKLATPKEIKNAD